MYINFNTWKSLSFFEPVTRFRFKPLVYVVSTLAIGILIYQCFKCFTRVLQERSWQVVISVAKQNQTMKGEKDLFNSLLENSKLFASRISFPTQNNLIQNLAITEELQQEVVEHAMTTRPVLPARIWSFIPKFLEYKKKFGSQIEKQLYQDMTPTQFVDRLIKKRPLMFMTGADSYLLRDGQEGAGGFDQIGTDQEKGSLCLKNYQSYFEMSLAAFLSVFTPTHFINNGDRYNGGIKGSAGTYESKGIYVGMVGARFEKPGLMEWAHMIVTPEQNTVNNGYGSAADPQNPKTIELRLWAELYQSCVGALYTFPTYEEVQKDTSGRYIQIQEGFLDTFIYKERLKLVIESFLLESNERAKQQGKMAYLHIVGLGLGVWQIDPRQKNLMLEVYAELLQKHTLDHISDLRFCYFGNSKQYGNVADGEFFQSQEHAIKIHFSERPPAEKLQGEDEDKLLIAQYAWDSNSYPGNEYWTRVLTASGDPAAACCSTIPQLQNPEINPYVQAKYLTVIPPVIDSQED